MRKITSFVSIVILMFILPFSVFAIPDNNQSGTYSIDQFSLVRNVTSNKATFSEPIYLNFGSVNLFRFGFTSNPNTGSSYISTVDLTVSLNLTIASNSVIYFSSDFSHGSTVSNTYNCTLTSITAKKNNSSVSLTKGSLDEVSFTGNYNFYNFTNDVQLNSIEFNNFGTTSISGSSIDFDTVSGLSAGEYTFTLTYRTNKTSANYTYYYLPICVFIDDPYSSGTGGGSGGSGGSEGGTNINTPVDDFINGDSSFEDTVNEIINHANSIINDSSATDEEKQLAISIASTLLQNLYIQSDLKYSQTVIDFHNNSSSIVNNYITLGSADVQDLNNAVNQLQINYSDAITQAVSPEQATAINTQYQLQLSRIKTVFDANYKKELDNVITEVELSQKEAAYSKLDNLLESESQAIDIFNEADYQGKLNFELWTDQYFYDDYSVYRSIFEYLFNSEDSYYLHPFLIIPFSLVLIGVLLATTTVVFRRR